MSADRRYSQAEIEEIFEIAAREHSSPPQRSDRDGLSLAELQAIGEEVGLSPERVARAAMALDRQGQKEDRLAVAGVPLGVRMSFALPDAPTDREWALLVTELRRTFGAEGKVTSAGELREWRNGNLHAVVEPTEVGFQLRLGTRKGEAPAYAVSGLFMLLMALMTLGEVGEMSIVFAVVGLVFLGQLARLPGWADERQAQMEYIGRRAIDLIGERAGDDGSVT